MLVDNNNSNNNDQENKSFIRWGYHPVNSRPILEVYIKPEDNVKAKFSKILFDMIPMMEETVPGLLPNKIGYKGGRWTLYEFHSWHNNVQDRLQEIVDVLNEKYLS